MTSTSWKLGSNVGEFLDAARYTPLPSKKYKAGYLTEDGWGSMKGSKYRQLTQNFASLGVISGTTLVEGVITPNTLVRLYFRKTGELLAEQRSGPTGLFEFTNLAQSAEAYYVIGFDPDGGYSYNAEIFDKLTPSGSAAFVIRLAAMSANLGGVCGSLTVSEDPFWAYVVSMTRFDGADGSTTLVCEKGGSYTQSGTAAIAAASAKYGAGGAKFLGTTGYNRWTVSGPVTGAVNYSAEFTIEAFVRFSSVAARSIPFSIDAGASGILAARLEANSAMSLLGFSNASGAGALGGTVIAAATWYHIAITRVTDGTVRLFVGGVLQASISDTGTKPIRSTTLGGCPSYYGQINNMNGDIDEFRVTDGIARYTADFTPPTARFPNR